MERLFLRTSMRLTLAPTLSVVREHLSVTAKGAGQRGFKIKADAGVSAPVRIL